MKAKIKGDKLILTAAFTGKRPWAAQVLGLDPERMFERRFLGVKVTRGGEGDSEEVASIALPLENGYIYELGAWEVVHGVEARGYFIIKAGKPVAATKDEVAASWGEVDEGEDVDLPF